MLIHSPKATCLVVGLCFNCWDPVPETQPPSCCSFPTHFWSLAHTTSREQCKGMGAGIITAHFLGTLKRLHVPGQLAGIQGEGLLCPHVTLVNSHVWEPLRQVALSSIWGALITMPSRGPGCAVTPWQRGKQPGLSTRVPARAL